MSAYPDSPLVVDRARHLLGEFTRGGVVAAVRALADHTALTAAHVYHADAEPLSEAQAVAVGRWVHHLADHVQAVLDVEQTPR